MWESCARERGRGGSDGCMCEGEGEYDGRGRLLHRRMLGRRVYEWMVTVCGEGVVYHTYIPVVHLVPLCWDRPACGGCVQSRQSHDSHMTAMQWSHDSHMMVT